MAGNDNESVINGLRGPKKGTTGGGALTQSQEPIRPT